VLTGACALPSLAKIAKENDPEVVGVPVIEPVLLERLNPGGRTPEDTVKEYGACPPLTETTAL
jgi:hypothetical protein